MNGLPEFTKIKQALQDAIDTDASLKAFRAYLEESNVRLTAQRLANWRSDQASDRASSGEAEAETEAVKPGARGVVPEILVLGAALGLLARIGHDAPPKGVPEELFARHRDAIERTNLHCRCVYHVFCVSDETGGDFQDVTVFRYWEGVRAIGGRSDGQPNVFTHTTQYEVVGDDNRPVAQQFGFGSLAADGQADIEVSVSKPPKKLVLMQWKLTDHSEASGGYWARLPDAVRSHRTSATTREFLGGINAVAAEASWIIAMIPARLVGRLRSWVDEQADASWVSFAAPLNPLQFIEDLTKLRWLDAATLRTREEAKLYLPWGMRGPVVEWNDPRRPHVALPQVLTDAIETRCGWRVQSEASRPDFAMLCVRFEYPQPLAFQAVVYALTDSKATT